MQKLNSIYVYIIGLTKTTKKWSNRKNDLFVGYVLSAATKLLSFFKTLVQNISK